MALNPAYIIGDYVKSFLNDYGNSFPLHYNYNITSPSSVSNLTNNDVGSNQYFDPNDLWSHGLGSTGSAPVSGTGGTSSVDLPSIQDFVSQLNSALESEFASSASQVQASKELIDYSNSFTKTQNELNRIFQQNSAEKAMKFSSEEAQKTREWQENMSSTAYQRVVADLQSAGLNPILAVSQGGASTPAGVAGTAYQAAGSAGSSAYGHAAKANAGSAWEADFASKKLAVNSASALFDTTLQFLGKLL